MTSVATGKELAHLGTRSGFNHTLRHIVNVTNLIEEAGKGANLADLLNPMLEQGILRRNQLPPILAVVLVEKLNLPYRAINLKKSVSDFGKLVESFSKWTGVNVVVAYSHPNLDLNLVNPSNEQHWNAISYLGWNASVYVASEIRDPGRNLPRSLFLGLGICAGIYLLVNGVYLYALPMDRLENVPDAGRAAGLALFGPLGGSLVGAFVLLSVLGTLNATVLVGPRIAYAMALDGLFFRGADRVHDNYRTPMSAIVVQAIVAIGLLLVLRTFPAALDFTVFAILLATSADVLALYRLRRTAPDRPRPYRAWGHPWVPGLYLLANLGIATAMLIGRPFECLLSVLLLLAGLPFYWRFVRRPDSGPGR